MAALRMREDQAGRMTMQSPLLPQMGNLLSMLVWVAVLGFFIIPAFAGDRIDWSNLLLILFFFLVTAGTSIIGSLVRTMVTVDPTTRTITSTQRLLNFPIRSTDLTFNDLESIANEYYRQSSGRYSHDAWRVAAVARDGRRIVINWNGKRDEMVDLAAKLSNRTGAQLVDNSEKPVSTVQQILGRMTGGGQETPPTAMGQQEESAQPSPPMPTYRSPSMTQPSPSPMESPPSSRGESYSTPSYSSDIPSAVPSSTAPETDGSVWKLSASELEQRVAADPIDSDARYALARRYQAQGQLDKAIDLYQKATALDPANAGVQNDMGVALQLRGKKGEAETAFRRAVALDPFSSTAHLNLGLLLRSMNRATDASQEFTLARQNAGNDAETRAAEAASVTNKMEPQLTIPG